MAGFRESKPADGAEPEHAEEPRRRGLDELSGKGGSDEDFPELADELKGIGDIADLLREVGRERLRIGEGLRRPFDRGGAGWTAEAGRRGTGVGWG